MLPHIREGLRLSAIGQLGQGSRWRTEAMRAHATPRLIFFTKGQGRITVAGLTSGYGANNLIFLPARTMYGYEVGPTAFGLMLTIPAAMAHEWPDEPVHLRLRDVMAQKEIATAFDHLERELGSDLAGHSRAAHYHLGLLAVLFERQMARRGEDGVDPRRHSAAARLVAAYSGLVERDFAKGRDIADFARDLGVTPTHLTRACRDCSGRTAHQILADRILFEARLRLRSDRQPIGKLAAELGFSSPAYFARAFQAATGMTPSAFRALGALPAI